MVEKYTYCDTTDRIFYKKDDLTARELIISEDVCEKLNILEHKLEEAMEKNKVIEKLVDDFDGAVRYIMEVAPQLDNIMERNITRIKKESQ